jgi:hypothetical protein
MRSKTFFVLVAIAAAYLLGARAGRDRYEQIVGSFSSFWNSPDVTAARKKAAKQAVKARGR